MYKSIDHEDIARLIEITAPERVITGDAISPDYSHDELGGVESLPEVLIKVLSTEEVAAIMKYANEKRIPVVVRGSGTGLVGAAVATHGGIMLETLLMNKILELDENNLTVTLQPGVMLMELAAFVESHDFLYPPDPGEKTGTIGGNINTNAGGMRAVKYGVTRDYVRGLTVVLPNGEIIKTGGKLAKNSTGYSIKDLIIGSEGTLGIVTEAVLKLIQLPMVSTSLLVPFPAMKEAIEAVPAIIKSRASLVAIEFMERDIILFAEEHLGKRFPDNKAAAYLLLTVDGNDKEAVKKELAVAAELCMRQGAADAYIVDTTERKDAVWKARGAFLEAIKASTNELDECDVVVPRDKVAEFILYSHEVAAELNVRIPSFGHAGDGNLHVYVCRDGRDETEWKQVLHQAFALLYKKANALGGLVSGEHGVGYAKKRYMAEAYEAAQLELMRGIKRVFDPNGILNPGKVV